MGYSGHLVATARPPGDAFPDAEPEEGDWAPGLHVWRVHDRLGPDWGPFEAFAVRLAGNVPGGFLVASVVDSDAALVHIGIPGQDVGWAYLHVEGIASHFVPSPVPYDDEGHPLPPDEVATQDADWQRDADAFVEQLRATALPDEVAAVRCREWAEVSGLSPASVGVVVEALARREAAVEDTFHGLLATLGARAEPRLPAPRTR